MNGIEGSELWSIWDEGNGLRFFDELDIITGDVVSLSQFNCDRFSEFVRRLRLVYS